MHTSFQLSKNAALVAAIALAIFVAWVDFQTHHALRLGFVYLVPVFLAAWYHGKGAGYLLTALSTSGYTLGRVVFGDVRIHPIRSLLNSLDHLLVMLALALVVAHIRRMLERERTLVKDLSESRESVKQLQGLLPICAWCKKIRNDRGYWEQMESYLTSHAEVSFTHGMCPECKEKLFAEVSQNQDKERL